MIFRFSFFFLSNMYPCLIEYKGCTYQCAEAAFQAQKCTNSVDKDMFTGFDGKIAKTWGRRVPLREDWNEVRIPIMEEIVRAKFLQNPELVPQLTSIKGYIQEDNSWHDTFWGVCNGIGKNNLGIILMKIRDEFLNT